MKKYDELDVKAATSLGFWVGIVTGFVAGAMCTFIGLVTYALYLDPIP